MMEVHSWDPSLMDVPIVRGMEARALPEATTGRALTLLNAWPYPTASPKVH